MATTQDYLKLHFIVFLWGFTAILGKLISIPNVEMVFYRTLLASVGMGVFIFLAKGTFKIQTTDLIKLLATGLIVAVHWLTFFGSGRISNPSTSLVGFATCSFWAALLEPLFKGKKIQPLEIGLGIVVMVGLSIIFSFGFQYPMGLFLGIISGVTAALFSIINSKMISRVAATTITFYQMIGATLGILLFLPAYKQFWTVDSTLQWVPTAMDWVYLCTLAWVCSVYAYSAAIELMKRLSVFIIQLTLNLEPLYGIILALAVFGQQEVMGINFYAGTLIIISAVVFYPYLKKKFEIP
ncbi:MAG: DMT family transporter [Bacteroidia bacterium]|nr:DMT family transporter [Bacteroidia bacterium]